jgi:hypothetical protein
MSQAPSSSFLRGGRFLCRGLLDNSGLLLLGSRNGSLSNRCGNLLLSLDLYLGLLEQCLLDGLNNAALSNDEIIVHLHSQRTSSRFRAPSNGCASPSLFQEGP